MALRPISGTVTIPDLHSFVPARRPFVVCLFAVNLSDLLATLRRLVLRSLSRCLCNADFPLWLDCATIWSPHPVLLGMFPGLVIRCW